VSVSLRVGWTSSRLQVDRILAARESGRQKSYLVSWTGYPDSEASWEPSTNLTDPIVIDMVKQFEEVTFFYLYSFLTVQFGIDFRHDQNTEQARTAEIHRQSFALGESWSSTPQESCVQ
jgi:hypothetical protein